MQNEMMLSIFDYGTDELLSGPVEISFIPVASSRGLHQIKTNEGSFDVDFVSVNIVENTITVHSMDYQLSD